jgi:exodeoxyribonuclease-3
MQRIISWNVASVRARLSALVKLIETEKPDVVLLQEIKAEDSTFPFIDFLQLGYHAVISGQEAMPSRDLDTRPF